MKNLKLVVVIFSVILLSLMAVYFIKQPSYTIKTDGTLYVVNKLSRSITIFDLFEGKQLKELSIEIEPHEATALTKPNRVIVTNYGTPDVEGKSITVIDADNNTKSLKLFTVVSELKELT